MNKSKKCVLYYDLHPLSIDRNTDYNTLTEILYDVLRGTRVCDKRTVRS